MRFAVRRLKLYVATVADPDGVTVHRFTFRARGSRQAQALARQWTAEDGWPALLDVRLDDERSRSLVGFAGVTAAVSACSISALTFLSLWAQGAL